MRIYHHPMSTNARRVLMVVNHLGIDTELVVVDLSKGEQAAPDFIKMNPNKRVPVLEHDGFVLWESYAIMQYLADTSGGTKLYPSDSQARADVNRWMFWCGQDLMPGIAILNWENAIKAMIGMGPADPAEVARGTTLFEVAATVLDQHLASTQWICESGLSLADLAIAAPFADIESAQLPVDNMPNLLRWLNEVKSLDAWQNSEV